MKRLFLLGFLLLSTLLRSEIELGRFSQVLAKKEGYLWNIHYSVYVERGFKVFAIVPKRENDQFGKSVYAGFLTLLIDDQYLFTQFLNPEDGTEILSHNDNHIIVAKSASNENFSLKTYCEVWIGYPYLRFWAEIEPKKQMKVQYVLAGYPWAGMTAPAYFKLHGKEEQEIKEGFILQNKEELRNGYVLFHSQEPVTYLFFFTIPPKSIYKNESEIRIAFTDTLNPGQKYVLPPIYYAILPIPPDELKQEVITKLQRSICSPPGKSTTLYGIDNNGPYIEYRSTFREEPSQLNLASLKLIQIPPTLTDIVKADFYIPSLFGDVGYIEGDSIRIHLPQPPNLSKLTINFPSLPDTEMRTIEKHLQDILSHQNPDGTFTFSRGRPFYDGLTASALIQLYPILKSPLKERVAQAVRKCLDHWWDKLERDEKTGIYWFPEPPPSIPQVDYPEITSTLLYPTAAYIKLVDESYIVRILGKAKLIAKTLPPAYDWTGSAYAFPGPDFFHIIVESTVGGYLSYACLYHLFNMAGEKELSTEFLARASFAFKAMAIYKHKPEYGEDNIVSEIKWDSFKIKIEIPWDYTMYTWFSFVPLWWLPKEDIYNLWNILQKQEWWRYYEKSAQRAYDYADLIAIHRFKKEDWRKYFKEFADKPFAYDYFDATPVFTVIAYPWLKVKED
ncbi:hypothetical protein H5T87_03675 [bacterium]|nr:hypothetical protein [bacterium]